MEVEETKENLIELQTKNETLVTQDTTNELIIKNEDIIMKTDPDNLENICNQNHVDDDLNNNNQNANFTTIENLLNQFSEEISLKLNDLFKSEKLKFESFDESLLSKLRELSDSELKNILDELEMSANNAENINYFELFRQLVVDRSALNNRSSSMNESQNAANISNSNQTGQQKPGPDEAKLKEILERTSYSHEISSGQRKYGGPPPDWDGPMPGNGCEIFVGKLPKETYEDVLIPLFEEFGKIWDLRVMIEPASGLTKGYAFITFCDKESARRAADKLNGYEVRPGKTLKVNVSIANVRLFIGNIPKSKNKEEIKEEFSKIIEGLSEVIVYNPVEENNEKLKNRGFCFLDFDSHKSASVARRKLLSTRLRIFNREIAVDWADPNDEPDEETMSKVKVLYVRNLSSELTEEDVKNKFEAYGSIERVRIVKDYAFVHYDEREPAIKAMSELNGQLFGKNNLEISLARPLSDKKKQAQQKREEKKRMDQLMKTGNNDWNSFNNRNNNSRNGGGNRMNNRNRNDNNTNDNFNENTFAAIGNLMRGIGFDNCNFEDPEALAMQFAAVAATGNMQGVGNNNRNNNNNNNNNNRSKNRNNNNNNNNKNNNNNNGNMRNNNNSNGRYQNNNNNNNNYNNNRRNGGGSGYMGANKNQNGNSNNNNNNNNNRNNNFNNNNNNSHYNNNNNNNNQFGKRKADQGNLNRNKKGRFQNNNNSNNNSNNNLNDFNNLPSQNNNLNKHPGEFQFLGNQPIAQQPLAQQNNEWSQDFYAPQWN